MIGRKLLSMNNTRKNNGNQPRIVNTMSCKRLTANSPSYVCDERRRSAQNVIDDLNDYHVPLRPKRPRENISFDIDDDPLNSNTNYPNNRRRKQKKFTDQTRWIPNSSHRDSVEYADLGRDNDSYYDDDDDSEYRYEDDDDVAESYTSRGRKFPRRRRQIDVVEIFDDPLPTPQIVVSNAELQDSVDRRLRNIGSHVKNKILNARLDGLLTEEDSLIFMCDDIVNAESLDTLSTSVGNLSTAMITKLVANAVVLKNNSDDLKRFRTNPTPYESTYGTLTGMTPQEEAKLRQDVLIANRHVEDNRRALAEQLDLTTEWRQKYDDLNKKYIDCLTSASSSLAGGSDELKLQLNMANARILALQTEVDDLRKTNSSGLNAALGLQNDLGSIQSEITRLKNELRSEQQQRVLLEEQLNRSQQIVPATVDNQIVARLQNQLDAMTGERDTLKLRILGLEQKIDDSHKQLVPQTNQLARFKQRIEELERDNRQLLQSIEKSHAENVNLENRLRNTNNQIAEKSTGELELQSRMNDLIAERNRLQTNLDAEKTRAEVAQKQLDDAKSQLQLVRYNENEAATAIQQQLRSLQLERDRLLPFERSVQTLQTELQRLQNQQLELVDSERKKYTRQIAQISEDQKKLEMQIDQFSQRETLLNGQIARLETENASKNNAIQSLMEQSALPNEILTKENQKLEQNIVLYRNNERTALETLVKVMEDMYNIYRSLGLNKVFNATKPAQNMQTAIANVKWAVNELNTQLTPTDNTQLSPAKAVLLIRNIALESLKSETLESDIEPITARNMTRLVENVFETLRQQLKNQNEIRNTIGNVVMQLGQQQYQLNISIDSYLRDNNLSSQKGAVVPREQPQALKTDQDIANYLQRILRDYSADINRVLVTMNENASNARLYKQQADQLYDILVSLSKEIPSKYEQHYPDGDFSMFKQLNRKFTSDINVTNAREVAILVNSLLTQLTTAVAEMRVTLANRVQSVDADINSYQNGTRAILRSLNYEAKNIKPSTLNEVAQLLANETTTVAYQLNAMNQLICKWNNDADLTGTSTAAAMCSANNLSMSATNMLSLRSNLEGSFNSLTSKLNETASLSKTLLNGLSELFSAITGQQNTQQLVLSASSSSSNPNSVKVNEILSSSVSILNNVVESVRQIITGRNVLSSNIAVIGRELTTLGQSLGNDLRGKFVYDTQLRNLALTGDNADDIKEIGAYMSYILTNTIHAIRSPLRDLNAETLVDILNDLENELLNTGSSNAEKQKLLLIVDNTQQNIIRTEPLQWLIANLRNLHAITKFTAEWMKYYKQTLEQTNQFNTESRNILERIGSNLYGFDASQYHSDTEVAKNIYTLSTNLQNQLLSDGTRLSGEWKRLFVDIARYSSRKTVPQEVDILSNNLLTLPSQTLKITEMILNDIKASVSRSSKRGSTPPSSSTSFNQALLPALPQTFSFDEDSMASSIVPFDPNYLTGSRSIKRSRRNPTPNELAVGVLPPESQYLAIINNGGEPSILSTQTRVTPLRAITAPVDIDEDTDYVPYTNQS